MCMFYKGKQRMDVCGIRCIFLCTLSNQLTLSYGVLENQKMQYIYFDMFDI